MTLYKAAMTCVLWKRCFEAVWKTQRKKYVMQSCLKTTFLKHNSRQLVVNLNLGISFESKIDVAEQLYYLKTNPKPS